MGAFYVIALGVPGVGAVSASLLTNFGGVIGFHSFTWANYAQVFSGSGLAAPLVRSAYFALITATVTVVAGMVVARLLVGKREYKSTRALDFLLLAAVALPGTVFAAGYIFAYNLPFLSSMGIALVWDDHSADHRLHRQQPAHERQGARRCRGPDTENSFDAGRTTGIGVLPFLAAGRSARALAPAGDGLVAHVLRNLLRASGFPDSTRRVNLLLRSPSTTTCPTITSG